MSKLARFARTMGARDKKKRNSGLVRNIAMGVGGAALLGGAAYLGRGKITGLMGKGKPPAATGGGTLQPPAPKPSSSGGGGTLQPPAPKPSSSGGGGTLQPPAPKPIDPLVAQQRESRQNFLSDLKDPNNSDSNVRKLIISARRGRKRIIADKLKEQYGTRSTRGSFSFGLSTMIGFRQSTMMSLTRFNRKWK